MNSCVHNQITTFGLLGRQSVTLNIGLNIDCSHNQNNRPSEQSAKCNIGQALLFTYVTQGLSCRFLDIELGAQIEERFSSSQFFNSSGVCEIAISCKIVTDFNAIC